MPRRGTHAFYAQTLILLTYQVKIVNNNSCHKNSLDRLFDVQLTQVEENEKELTYVWDQTRGL